LSFIGVRRRRYEFVEVVSGTKRAWMVRVPNQEKLVRLPKGSIEFDVFQGVLVVWVSDPVAEFAGLVEEVTL